MLSKCWRDRSLRLTGVALATVSIIGVSRVDLRAEDVSSAPSADASPSDVATAPRQHWGVLFYHSLMTDDSIWQVLSGNVTLKFGQMDTLEVSYELDHENVFKHHTQGQHGFWRPFAGSLYLANSLTRREGDPGGDIFEVASYVMWRTRHVPVAPFLATTFAFGDGLSYTTKLPEREMGGQRLKNFMTLEGTLGVPSHRDVEVVLRVHHRCDAWGLFPGASSNAIGMGVRYSF
jgi:hypothetical protein